MHLFEIEKLMISFKGAHFPKDVIDFILFEHRDEAAATAFYLNNLIEQDHRFIKKISIPMMGFKAFHSAMAKPDGIETAHMLRKRLLSENNMPAYKQFMSLAG